MSKSEETKAKVFHACDQVIAELLKGHEGELKATQVKFNNNQVMKFSASTNKQAVIKYAELYRELLPLKDVLPGFSWEMIESIQKLSHDNHEQIGNAVKASTDKMVAELEELNDKNIELEVKLDEANREVNDVNTSNKELEKDLRQAKDNVARANEKLEQQEKEHLNQHALLVSQHNTETVLYKEKLKNINDRFEVMTNDYATKVKNLSDTVSELNTSISSLRTKLQEVSLENQTLSVKLLSEKDKCKEQSKLILNLEERTSQIDAVNSELGALRERERGYMKSIAELENKPAPISFDQYMEELRSNGRFGPVLKEYDEFNNKMPKSIKQCIAQFNLNYKK